jgi:flagellar protein FliL
MADNEQAEGAADESTQPTSRLRDGKFRLVIIAVTVLATLGIGTATWFLFFRHPSEEMMRAEASPARPPVFVEVPDILVNLVTGPGERVQYLRVKAVLELREEKQVEAIKPSMPRVSDIFQTYMRELRPADLNGSVGLFRLKEELTRRVNTAVAPIQVSAVLFKEIVVQ